MFSTRFSLPPTDKTNSWVWRVLKSPDIAVKSTRIPGKKSCNGVKRKVSLENMLMFQLLKKKFKLFMVLGAWD